MRRVVAVVVSVLAVVGLAFALPATAGAADAAKKGKGKKSKTVTVCKFGCKYKSIQKAVNKTGKNATIKVKPGKYKEGVIVEGHKHDGLTIKGTKKNPRKTILEGKNAKSPDGLAQNGIEGIDVNKLTIKNMWARNYATNGFFIRDSAPAPNSKIDCKNFLMKNLVASYNRSYGMYAFGCKGGRVTDSEGYGHGDSAVYIGATPFQKNPKTTKVDHIDAYENVLGYSGTNSRYVKIANSDWYNNGIGIVPNTLDSEPFEPTGSGVIKKNNIFWNNFNYFLPNSGVETVSNGLGTVEIAPGVEITLQYPTGVGVALFGASDWVVKNNEIFGNFKYGTAVFSDPFNADDDAVSMGNQIINNKNGRGGTDVNATDIWSDGSGSGNCYSGNSSQTLDPSGDKPNSFIYPSCPAPAGTGTGTSSGVADQVLELLGYVGSDPPETQECAWTQHEHPPFKKFEPVDVTPGPTC